MARSQSSGGMTAKEGRAFRADVRRGLKDEENRRYKARIDELDEELQRVREQGRTAQLEQRERCSAEYQAIKDEADRLFRAAQAALVLERRAKKEHKKRACKIDADAIRQQAQEEKHIAKRKLDEERAHRRELRRIEHTNATRDRERTRVSAAERRQESDGEVESNLDPREVAVWRRLKRVIRPSDRKSRTEAFHDYLHDNGGLRAVEAELGLDQAPSDRELARERQAFERKQAKASRRPNVPF